MNFISQHEALRERITTILGGEYDGETRIRIAEVYSNGWVVVTVVTLFDKDNIPKNLVKKNRSFFSFDLHFNPSNLQVEFLGADANKNEINILTEHKLKISLGDFSYLYTADKIDFSHFLTKDRSITA